MRCIAKTKGFVIINVRTFAAQKPPKAAAYIFAVHNEVMFMTEIKKEGQGAVFISDEVLAVIAGTAALEAEGVAGLLGYYHGNNQKAVRKQMSKVISVQVNEGAVKASLSITAKFGAKLHEVAKDVQKRVKMEVENMTGLVLTEVNVTVGAIVGENKKA